MLFFGLLLVLADLSNTFTEVDNHQRAGDPLPFWKPAVWEGSSHLLVFLLIPLVWWWLSHFPITRAGWWRSLPAHLLGVVLFSLLHMEGMVLLRKAAYWAAASSYDFGPFWSNWVYEFRKDFV